MLLAGDLFGWQASLPWEFTNDNPVSSPIRSILPIWLVYGLPIRIIKMIYGGTIAFFSLSISLIARQSILILCYFSALWGLLFLPYHSWTVYSIGLLVVNVNSDWAVYRLAGETHCRSAVLLYASSYVTWTFQTHTFSNSIEAVLVSCSLVTILKFKHTRVES